MVDEADPIQTIQDKIAEHLDAIEILLLACDEIGEQEEGDIMAEGLLVSTSAILFMRGAPASEALRILAEGARSAEQILSERAASVEDETTVMQ